MVSKQLAETKISIDYKSITQSDRKIISLLRNSSEIIDKIFLDQVNIHNEKLLKRLEAGTGPVTKELSARIDRFKWNAGPWDRYDDDKPFIGNMKKPEGAGFYPIDMTKAEFENWTKKHPSDKEVFTSPYTVIKRNGSGLVAVKYSDEYKESLLKVAKLMREAAKESTNKSLKIFLDKRADALLSNDYRESDIAWLKLDSKLDVVVGPYEVYEDRLFGYKAAFELAVSIRDVDASKKLEIYSEHLSDLDKNLPIDKKYKFTSKSQESTMIISNQIVRGGMFDIEQCIPMAFNLPNDEHIRENYGSKKVMLKNIMEAKFEKILMPISRRIIDEKQLKYIKFDTYLNFVMLHEVSHGLGPAQIIKPDGTKISVNDSLRDLHSGLEEAKADISGVYSAIYLTNKGILPEGTRKEIYTAYVADIFRTVRFGPKEAHGIAHTIGYNHLKENGAIVYDKNSNMVSVDYKAAESAFHKLLEDLLRLQLEGDYNKAKSFVVKYSTFSNDLKRIAAKCEGIPIDIRPIFES